MRLGTNPITGVWAWIVVGCLCIWPLTTAQVAWAQKPKPDAAAKPDKNNSQTDPKRNAPAAAKPTDGLNNTGGAMEIAKVEGKLEAMQQGVIKLGTADKKEIFLQSGPLTVIAYTAEADVKWLSPGVSVRFTANFDAAGKPTAPLKSLEVFTPVMTRRLSPEQMREQTPGVYQEGKEPPAGAKNLFNGANNKAPATRDKKEPLKKDTDAANKDTAKKDTTKKDATTKKDSKKEASAVGGGKAYRVVGQLTNMQDNMILVIAGQPMQLELAPDCQILVTANELQTALSLAVKGDDVTVSGLRNPAQPAIVMAEQITIKAAKKLTQPEVLANKRTRQTRGKDDDDKGRSSKDKDGKDKDNDKKKTADKKK